MTTTPRLPSLCPGCGRLPLVTRLSCEACGTTVDGRFDLPLLARLGTDDHDFVLQFVRAGGSLKEMARRYGVSYPTVRNRLDALIDRLETPVSASEEPG